MEKLQTSQYVVHEAEAKVPVEREVFINEDILESALRVIACDDKRVGAVGAVLEADAFERIEILVRQFLHLS